MARHEPGKRKGSKTGSADVPRAGSGGRKPNLPELRVQSAGGSVLWKATKALFGGKK